MFKYCNNFNKPIVIPDNTVHCGGMFTLCNNFNSDVTIGNNVQYANRMFENCVILDKTILIPNNVFDLERMFENCYKLRTVTFGGDGVYSKLCTNMFKNCISLTEIRTVDSVRYCNNMFYRCTNLTDIYIKSTPYCFNMIQQKNMSKRLNIHTNSFQYFNNNKAANSIVGYDITWSASGSTIRYNTYFNVYLMLDYT